MDEIDRFGYQLIFTSIAYSITNRRTNLSKTALIYLDEVKKFFDNIVRGLESVIGKRDYFFVEDLRKIVELAGYESSHASKEDVKEMIAGFKKTATQLNRLEKNPKEFYNSENSQELLTLCNKVKDLYTDNPQVITDEVLFDS